MNRRMRNENTAPFATSGMIIGFIALFAFVLLPAVADEEQSPETDHPLIGKVTMSNGETLTGGISISGENPLVFYDIERKKRLLVPLADLSGLRAVVEREEMAEKWVWKEEGFHEKIMTGEKYPVRTFFLDLLYPDGRKVRGHVISATLYVEVEGGERQKLKLVRKQTGEVGQELKDLAYVSAVDFEGNGAKPETPATPGSASIRIKSPEKILKVWLLQYEQDQIFEAALQGEIYAAANLPYGTYDAIVETESSFFLQFWKPDGSRGKAAALAPVNMAGLEEMLKQVGDFFQTQRVVHWAGSPEKMRGLILSERLGDTTLPGAELIRRYDVFVFHKVETEWKIDRRLFLSRNVFYKGESSPARKINPTRELSGLKITGENPKLEIEVSLIIRREGQP